MIQIISHTPLWVFLLFFSLIYLGYIQTKSRQIILSRIFIIPVVMLVLSLFSLNTIFTMSIKVFLIWFIFFILSIFISNKLFSNKHIKYDKLSKLYTIKGSYIPMFLILVIFSLKYYVGVVSAIQSEIIYELSFFYTIIILYGILNGLFITYSYKIYSSKNNYLFE